MLCAACTNILTRVFKVLRPGATHQISERITGAGFQQSVHSGCKICAHLCLDFTTDHGQLADDHATDLVVLYVEKIRSLLNRPLRSEVSSQAVKNASQAPMELTMLFESGIMGAIALKATLNMLEGAASGNFTLAPCLETLTFSKPRSGPIQGLSTADPEAWSTAMTWVNDCLAGHEKCRPDHDANHYHPRRLVDVGTDTATTIKVVDTTETQVTGAYTSLSHCWGLLPPYRLLTAGMKTAFSGIPTAELPRSFQDAIIITRRLGIQFIWIDSLCIVQDDVDDWRNEAARMAEVYSNSFCNLAALASPDCHGGLFYRRRDIQAYPTFIEPTEGLLFNGRYLVECVPDHSERNDPMPLVSRAWVLQERFFAKRTLFFGRQKLFWECGQSNMSETWPIRTYDFCRPLGPYTPIEYLKTDTGAQWATSNPDYASKWKPCMWWTSLVQEYSRCHLTFRSDKLVAISAMAKKIREVVDTQYLAGLWRRSLPFDLCWAATNPSPRLSKYHAPSWSWAAIDSPLKEGCWIGDTKTDWTGFYPAVTIDVIDTDITPAGDDDTGQVLDAWICLRGRPLPITIGHIRHIESDGIVGSELRTGQRSDLHGTCEMEIHWDYIGDSTQFDKLVYLLPIVQQEFTEGIVLERAVDKGDGFFRRLAHFVLLNGGRKKWNDFCRSCIDSEDFFSIFGPPGPFVPQFGQTNPLSQHGALPKQAMILV